MKMARQRRESEQKQNGSRYLLLTLHQASITIIVFTSLLCGSQAQKLYIHGDNPWDDFDNSIIVRTYYGDVKGFSVPWHVEDEAWRPDWDDHPKWFVQRVNAFLGVPYAEPPVGRLRFQKPRRPRWGGTWDSTYFRNSCPQDISYIHRDIPSYPKRNVSEDCLYLNVFAPNITWHNIDTLYPVVVFLHGGEFIHGTAQIYPGQVLVKQEIVVVTVNYRLGALGFLTTEDEHAPGNWGLWDQRLALEFVRENIKKFHGDPKQITLMGDEAGAASVGHMIISPITNDKNYYQKAILMSGSDLAGIATVNPFWRPRDYSHRLGQLLGCNSEDSYFLLKCLRDNHTHTWEDIVRAQAQVVPHDGALGYLWGPVQDGGYVTLPFLPDTPINLRRQNTFAKVPIMIGINQQDGSMKANRTQIGLGNGLLAVTYDEFLTKQLRSWNIMDRYWERAKEAVWFQYTYWPDPENRTARAQEFINLITDLDYGIGMDAVIKHHAPYESSYMYVWSYKSWEDYLPHWMGSSQSSQIPYVFGYPFMNETVLNETELVMKQWYNWEDRNMSDCAMLMWTNFIKYTVPTPNVTVDHCNATWDPYQENNLTYFIMDYHKHMWFRYNQVKYSFWSNYFPLLAKQDYLIPTATPTPMGYVYVYATGSMSAVLAVALLMLVVLVYLLYKQTPDDDITNDARYDESLPPSFRPGPNGSDRNSRGSSVSASSRQGTLEVDYAQRVPTNIHVVQQHGQQPQYSEQQSGQQSGPQYGEHYRRPYGQQYEQQQYAQQQYAQQQYAQQHQGQAHYTNSDTEPESPTVQQYGQQYALRQGFSEV